MADDILNQLMIVNVVSVMVALFLYDSLCSVISFVRSFLGDKADD